MKKQQILGLCLVFCLSLIGCTTSLENQETTASYSDDSSNQTVKQIGIIQIIEHPSLDTIRQATIEALEEQGFKDGQNCQIDYKNGSGNMSTLNTIVNSFENNSKDLVIAIATPSAQAAAKLSAKTPLVFSAVTDPVAARLVSDLKDTSHNITGTSDAVAVDKILELAMDIIPGAKNIGIIYSTSEANSVTNVEKARAFAKAHNLTLIEQGITSTAEVQQAALILADKVDFIFTPNDNTVASAMPTLTKVQLESKVPVFVGADSMVIEGGLATVGIDYTALGKATGQMAAQILNGTSTDELPVKVFDSDLKIFVNESVAKTLGVDIPEKIKNDAAYTPINQ